MSYYVTNNSCCCFSLYSERQLINKLKNLEKANSKDDYIYGNLKTIKKDSVKSIFLSLIGFIPSNGAIEVGETLKDLKPQVSNGSMELRKLFERAVANYRTNFHPTFDINENARAPLLPYVVDAPLPF